MISETTIIKGMVKCSQCHIDLPLEIETNIYSWSEDNQQQGPFLCKKCKRREDQRLKREGELREIFNRQIFERYPDGYTYAASQENKERIAKGLPRIDRSTIYNRVQREWKKFLQEDG
jgi:hypothetical protein